MTSTEAPLGGADRQDVRALPVRPSEMTGRTDRSRPQTALEAAQLIVLLGLAEACWVVAVQQMSGMNMGTATELGSLGFFVAAWVPMMAAMMLPGAVPAAARLRGALAVPSFAASYLAVWTAVGLAVYAVYRPHGVAVAGALTIAAGLYELTPLKRHCRRRCRETVRTGFEFGVYCVGSSIGLMVVLLALGAMSVTWMALVAVLVLAQKLLPPRTAVDVPVALAIVGLGILVAT
jgi:predicted metal-binding membrane protein